MAETVAKKLKLSDTTSDSSISFIRDGNLSVVPLAVNDGANPLRRSDNPGRREEGGRHGT